MSENTLSVTKLGKFDLSNPYRIMELKELDQLAIDDDNKLAIAILNRVGEEVDNEISYLKDRLSEGLDERGEWFYTLNDCRDVIRYIRKGLLEWSDEVKISSSESYYFLSQFDGGIHGHNHEVKLVKTKLGNQTLYDLCINHGGYGELYNAFEVKAKTISSAKKQALELLIDVIVEHDIQLALT